MTDIERISFLLLASAVLVMAIVLFRHIGHH